LDNVCHSVKISTNKHNLMKGKEEVILILNLHISTVFHRLRIKGC